MATTPVGANPQRIENLNLKPALMETTVQHLDNQGYARRHTVAGTASIAAQEPDLPSGWIELKDPNGKAMFYNAATGQTSWQRPMIRKLPPGWQKIQSPDGKALFFHKDNGTVSYEWPLDSNVDAMAGRTYPVQKTAQSTIRKQVQRSSTAPVAKGQSTVQISLNLDTLKEVPGLEQAYAVHQLSANNNTKVLSQKLAADMTTTSMALMDTSITAASLATRQAKVVGKTMINPKKMQKISKKMIVQTGAMTLQAARACKVLASDMVDAADQKGKYQPKEQRPFVPYKPKISGHLDQQGSITLSASGQSSHNSPGPGNPSMSGLTLSYSASMMSDLHTTIPARKPIRKPVARPANPLVSMNAQSVSSTETAENHVHHNVTNHTTEIHYKPTFTNLGAETKISHNPQAQAQLHYAIQHPTQASVEWNTSDGPSVQSTSQSSSYIHAQGQLQAGTSIRPQNTGAILQASVNTNLNLRPQVSATAPPPSYDQAVRPSGSTTRPSERPTHGYLPQTAQPNQSDNVHVVDVDSLSQMVHQTCLSSSHSHQTVQLHGPLTSNSMHQEHPSPQQHTALDHGYFNTNQTQTTFSGYQQVTPAEVYGSNSDSLTSQDHQIYGNNGISLSHSGRQEQQAEFQGSSVVSQQGLGQQSVLQDKLTGAESYVLSDATYPTNGQEHTAMALSESHAVVYEEVYLDGGGRAIAQQEIVYVDDAGSFAYEETTIAQDGDELYFCEDAYADTDQYYGEEVGIEDTGDGAEF